MMIMIMVVIIIMMIITRRANAQTIHVCHTYRTSSLSSLLRKHHEYLSCFMQLYDRMTAHKLSCNPVTFSEHQGHSNWNQTVEVSRV